MRPGPRKQLVFTSEQIAEMVALYRHGWSCERLAERFGCLGGSIHRRLIDAGVKLRPKIGTKRRQARIHSNGYVLWGGTYVHRIVAAAMLDRPLARGEVVHHRDGDKTNNHPDNLQVFPSHSLHMHAERDRRVWWTPERDSTLRALRAAGLTARAIAAEMGSTKAAVDVRVQTIGIARRKGEAWSPVHRQRRSA